MNRTWPTCFVCLEIPFADQVLWELIDKEGDEDGDNLLSEKAGALPNRK